MTRPGRRSLFVLGGTAAVFCLVGARCRSHVRPASSVESAGRGGHAVVAPEEGIRNLYGQTIVVDSGASRSLRDAVEAAASLLGSATRSAFRIKNEGSQGIVLLRSSAAGVPPDVASALRDRGREAYYLRGDRDRFLIVANADDGLTYGLYRYLEKVGVRFYFPSERWTVVPSLLSIDQREDALFAPAFRVRGFVGTGGFGGHLFVDPGRQLGKRWETWKTRVGFGEEFHISGHMGEAFNERHKEQLLAHPEYLASVKGRRQWSKAVKLDPTNASAVDLFVKDRVAAYRNQQAKDPVGPQAFAVSVEPADGGLHCDSPECSRIGGPSEQQFYLANAVARALRAEFPDARASLFAYNKHAQVPDLPIEPNVYVTLVPYAFRGDSADSPEEFIRAWTKKKSPVSLYDYWSLPDWGADLPDFDYRTTAQNKIKFWHQQGIEGVGAETTYSAGAMGLALYLSGHIMWNLQLDSASVAAEFFRDCFGAAAPPMRRMLERWADGFFLTSSELHDSFADLADALSLAQDPEVVERIADYAGYVQYLRLRYEYQVRQDRASKRALLLHLWRIYDTAMVHAFRLSQLLQRGDEPLTTEFAVQDGTAPGWKDFSRFGVADARRAVALGVSQLSALEVRARRYAGALVLLEPGASVPESVVTLVGSNTVDLTVDSDGREVRLEVRATSEVVLRLLGGQDEEIARTRLTASPAFQTWVISIQPKRTYRMELGATKVGKTTLKVPAGVGVELTDPKVPSSSPVDLFFYVPRGESRVALYNRVAFAPSIALVDGAGALVPTQLTDGGHLLSAVVHPGGGGKIWTIRGVTAPNGVLRVLNAPQRFALSKTALRVPEAALRAGGG